MSNFGINSYINTMNNTPAAANNGNSKTGMSAGAQNAAALGNSSAGDIITGEVVSANGKTVQIQLDNKSVITARVLNDMNVSVGQSLAFEIKSNSNGQISLAPLFTNTTMNPAMIKAISQASLPLSEQTINMTSAMMDNGMGIDRQSMQQMYSLINEHMSAEPMNLVSMKALGIPVNQDNIEQFSIYKNNEHQILGAGNELSDELLKLSSDLSDSSKGDLIEIINGPVDDGLLNEMRSNLVGGINQQAMETVAENKEEATYVGPFGASFANADETVEEASLLNEPLDLEEGLNEKLVAAENNETSLGILLNSEQREELANVLKSFGVMDDKLSQLLDATASTEDVMKNIQAALKLSNEGIGDKKGLDSFILSQGFKNLFKDRMTDAWTIKASDEFSKNSVDKLYQKISQDSQKILDVLEHAGKNDTPAAQITHDLQQNLNFMNDLNQMCQYVQLPIKLTNEEAHGDLFVYTNKKKLSSKDGEVSALLHLEMQTLGTMDIHIAMKDVAHVNTHFYLEDDKMLDFVAEHLDELDARLEQRGYNMHSVASVREKQGITENEEINKSVATMLGLDKHKMLSKYSFDMRA